MKGKSVFTKKEEEKIRLVLRGLRATPPNRQKAIRDQLRSVDFYISDWAGNDECFTVAEFDRLIEIGRVTIL